MRGPLAVLLLIVGWAVMYFLLMGAIPEHQREQTDDMPGTHKAAPLVRDVPVLAEPETPGASERPAGGEASAPEDPNEHPNEQPDEQPDEQPQEKPAGTRPPEAPKGR